MRQKWRGQAWRLSADRVCVTPQRGRELAGCGGGFWGARGQSISLSAWGGDHVTVILFPRYMLETWQFILFYGPPLTNFLITKVTLVRVGVKLCCSDPAPRKGLLAQFQGVLLAVASAVSPLGLATAAEPCPLGALPSRSSPHLMTQWFSTGRFAPHPGTFGAVWRHFWLSQLGRG